VRFRTRLRELDERAKARDLEAAQVLGSTWTVFGEEVEKAQSYQKRGDHWSTGGVTVKQITGFQGVAFFKLRE